MVTLDTIEGLIDGTLWYHYDVGNDVLYTRLASQRTTTALGEETEEGFILLRDEKSNRAIGLTVVDFWRRFGEGELPDSIDAIQRQIVPVARRLAA